MAVAIGELLHYCFFLSKHISHFKVNGEGSLKRGKIMSASHRSPKKLQRSIHNQLLSLPSNSHLSFSRSNLLPTHHTLPAIISQFQLHSTFITSLDCHFSILNKASVSTFCQCLVNLEELKLVDCRLKELDPTTSWPIRLRCIDFSRNQLTKCPQGLASLVYLTTLNLSGNLIQQLDPALLRLPLLEKLYLVQNPVQNIPKCVCREGVGRMREYFKVEPLPPPKPYPPLSNSSLIRLPNSRKTLSSVCDFEKCHDLRRLLLRQRGSFDSDYESTRRCRSTSNSSIDTCDSNNSAGQIQCPLSEHFQPPSGYSPAAATNLCQIYLPEGCEDNICVELVKDLSLYPKLESNELLVTPVVQITPHGRRFSAEQPAIIWLPHCTKSDVVIGDGHDVMFKQELVPVCSDSGPHQPTTWGKLGSEHCCEMFLDHVIFRTTHFSLFAVVSVLPYPSASISVGPNYGGTLTVAELPGFEVNLPPSSSAEGLTVTATVYYDDAPYNIESNDRTLASPCVGLEPHGAQFDKPVQITLPIPNYPEILSHFQDAKLELWHATPSTTQRGMSAPPNPENWELFRNGDISIGERDGIHVLIFTTNHFSWWETLWDIGRRALQRIGLTPTVDVSRTRYVSVRVQALMSPPVRVGVLGATTDIQTFGLLVAVYKFGAPLTQLSNYPWSLLDTGSKRIYLQLGQLEVSVQGYFSAMEYEDPTSPLSRSAELIEFNGDDFCQRFEFALQLKPGYEVCDGMLIGKLHFKQWSGSNPSHKNYNLVIEVYNIEVDSQLKN